MLDCAFRLRSVGHVGATAPLQIQTAEAYRDLLSYSPIAKATSSSAPTPPHAVGASKWPSVNLGAAEVVAMQYRALICPGPVPVLDLGPDLGPAPPAPQIEPRATARVQNGFCAIAGREAQDMT
jgi:hypothetical protein